MITKVLLQDFSDVIDLTSLWSPCSQGFHDMIMSMMMSHVITPLLRDILWHDFMIMMSTCCHHLAVKDFMTSSWWSMSSDYWLQGDVASWWWSHHVITLQSRISWHHHDDHIIKLMTARWCHIIIVITWCHHLAVSDSHDITDVITMWCHDLITCHHTLTTDQIWSIVVVRASATAQFLQNVHKKCQLRGSRAHAHIRLR